MNKLIIADDEGKTTVVPLVRDEITIGRKEGNTIRLTERNVSRRHARLLRSNGAFVLEDMESYNGVRVNGELITEARQIADGDKITIGNYQLSLRSDRPAGPKIGAAADEEPPDYARLVMLGPPNPGQEFALEEGELVIGRTDENAIVINHRSISRSHAKVIVSESGCRLVDLDSANGIRVNNNDYTDVELSSGDLVELGTVRLRFVGPGELYQFDADATVQMDAVPEDILDELDEEHRSLLPIIIAVAVVALIGVGVALAIFLGGGSTESGAGVTVEAPPTGDEVPAPPPAAEGPDPAKRLKMARMYHEQQRYEESNAILAGLGDAMTPEARALQQRNREEQDAQRIWARACNRADPSDLHTIFSACKQIPPDSRYSGLECCSGIGERYGRAQIEAAKQQRRNREPEQAIALLQGVIDDAAIPQARRSEAQELLERWNRASAGGGREPIAKAPPRTPRTPRTPQKAPPRPRENVSNPPASGGESPIDRARAAILRNDQAGCIRALRGVNSSRGVRLLISCYQRAGNLPAACALARRHAGSMSHARQFAQARCH